MINWIKVCLATQHTQTTVAQELFCGMVILLMVAVFIAAIVFVLHKAGLTK